MDKTENEQERLAMGNQASTKESCIPYFDALWYCYSKHSYLCMQRLSVQDDMRLLACLLYCALIQCMNLQHLGINFGSTIDMAPPVLVKSSGVPSWIA